MSISNRRVVTKCILDTGASVHVVNNIKYFKSFTKHSKLLSVPGHTTRSEGQGTLIIHLYNTALQLYDKLVLTEVLYIPKSSNLVSYSRLRKIGFEINTANMQLYSTENTHCTYNLKFTEGVMTLPCVIKQYNKQTSSGQRTAETDHLISRTFSTFVLC